MPESKEIKKVTRESLEVFHQDIMTVWTNTSSIRKMFAPNLSDDEFRFFCGMGVALGANPFKREIFAVKYGDQPASIIVARDFQRRKAQEQPDYMGHYVEAVYPFEKFVPNPVAGTVEHIIDTTKRYGGTVYVEPLGAYCVVLKKDKHPFYVFVSVREYVQVIKDKKTGEKRRTKFWQNQVETMIKKVAENQGLKGAYQGIFAGTVSEEELETEKQLREEDNSQVIENLTSKIVQRGQIANGKTETKKQPEPEPESEPPTEEVETTEVDENIFPAGHPWGGHNIQRVNDK